MKKLLLIALMIMGCAAVIETAFDEHLDNVATTLNQDDDLKQAWIGEHKSLIYEMREYNPEKLKMVLGDKY